MGNVFVLFAALLQQGVPPPSPTQAPRHSTSGKITIPLDSMLVGTVMVSEIRALPDQSANGRAQSEVEKVVGVEAADQLYQTSRPYKDAVAFFDQQFKSGSGFVVNVRTTTPTSTAWTVKRPDGKVATVVVRNTTPTTFEIVELAQRAMTP